MSDIEKYLDEHGIGLAIGLILGIGLIFCLVAIIAMGDRRPPDRKDDP